MKKPQFARSDVYRCIIRCNDVSAPSQLGLAPPVAVHPVLVLPPAAVPPLEVAPPDRAGVPPEPSSHV